MTAPADIRLPVGLRDYLPVAAARREWLMAVCGGRLGHWGYERVMLPPFEYDSVLGRGLGDAGRAAAFRFVEPATAEVVVLPPDVTPQLARLVATHHSAHVGPVRLSYDAQVVRRDGARGQRAILQIGLELYGVAGAEGDAEVIAAVVDAVRQAGLDELTVDLGHPGHVRRVLARLPLAVQEPLRHALARKDIVAVRTLAEAATEEPALRAWCAALPTLYGPPAEVLERVAGLELDPAEVISHAHLRRVVTLLAAALPAGVRVSLDLGDVRGLGYYTGCSFAVYARGAPDAIASGGRYDELLGAYGRALPATGMAIDVERLADATGRPGGERPRAVHVMYDADSPGLADRALTASQGLRARGLRITAPEGIGTGGRPASLAELVGARAMATRAPHLLLAGDAVTLYDLQGAAAHAPPAALADLARGEHELLWRWLDNEPRRS